MNQSRFTSLHRVPLAGLVLLTVGTAPLPAEDAFVTSFVGSSLNDCPPSCPYSLDAMDYYGTVSSAVPSGPARSMTVYGRGTNAAWAVTPTLTTSPGAYRVYVSQGATNNCSIDLHIKIVATSGCTLADTNYNGQTQIDTTAFQRGASLNVWTPVAVITNNSTTPTLSFVYASGASNRWYMDEVRFEDISSSTVTPARITRIQYGNPLIISGTGPVSRPFALISSTNVRKPLDAWTPEQTNTAGTGSFTFTNTPGSASARYFRVIIQ
jgi:hypothetical protein